MADSVPYRAYKSKRHSRNLSNTFTPPQSPPLPPIGSPSKSPRLQSTSASLKRLSFPGPPAELPVSEKAEVSSPNSQPEEPILSAASPHLAVAQIAINEVPPSPVSEPPTAPISPQIVEESSNSQPINGTDTPKSRETPEVVKPPVVSTPAPAPVTTAASDDPAAPMSVPRLRHLSSSTFRHVPARASPLRPSASVLGSNQRGPNTNSYQNQSHLVLGAQLRTSSAASVSSIGRPRSMLNPISSKVVDFGPNAASTPSTPTIGENNTFSQSNPVTSRSTISSSVPTTPTTPQKSLSHIAPPPPPKSTTPSPNASPSRPQDPPTPSQSPVPRPPASPAPNTTRATTRSIVAGNAPYRHGFQPKGVYVQRTDEFLEARRLKRGVAKIEDKRLERRLEKLIDLHFPSLSKPSTPAANNPVPEMPPQARRQSSFFDFDLSELKGKNASDLWRGVLDSAASTRLGGANAKGEIRQQEMAITSWQEDSTVPACPLCLAGFNALTNRKHHCRLCGRVVCSLPIKPPNRKELCSFLFFVDTKTGMIEELSGDVIDYGVKRKEITGGKGDAMFAKKLAEEQEKYLKGVRICRDCRPALRRKQYTVEAGTVPPIARLYDALLALEKEIEEMLPQFQELVIRLSQDESDGTATQSLNGTQQNSSVKQASSLRKHLLDAFSQYDAISKRIKSLKTTPGSSQEKVQNAISNRATLFLQRNLFPLQSLPKPKMTHSKNSSTTTLSLPTNLGDITDQDAALAHTLQPLLEQEALLESFIEEATAQRKFEDAKTLKANLKEIRGEIEQLLNGRGLPGQGTASAK